MLPLEATMRGRGTLGARLLPLALLSCSLAPAAAFSFSVLPAAATARSSGLGGATPRGLAASEGFCGSAAPRLVPLVLRAHRGQSSRRVRGGGSGLRSARSEIKVSGNDKFLIGVGSLSITALLINRLGTLELAPAQSRVDLLGVAVSSAMILTALARADIQAKEKETVRLAGVEQDEQGEGLDEGQKRLLRWAAQLVTKVARNARGVAVWHGGRTALRFGVMGRAQTIEPGPILESACSKGSQAYLADLQILPGRFEFTYLPINTQAVLIQPFGKDGAIIVCADKIRPFTALDLRMVPFLGRLLEAALDV